MSGRKYIYIEKSFVKEINLDRKHSENKLLAAGSY